MKVINRMSAFATSFMALKANHKQRTLVCLPIRLGPCRSRRMIYCVYATTPTANTGYAQCQTIQLNKLLHASLI